MLERPFLRQKDLLAVGLHIHVTVITIVETIAEIKAVPLDDNGTLAIINEEILSSVAVASVPAGK